ncbi:hypothetical protein ABT095_11150 [Kitasatospora sp. NPDC002227]|uniref:hypothetical protein n=1 Tax=Kitasatospora sp. NPDC002227 TaxID=3154773 RepID=UPI00332B8C20
MQSTTRGRASGLKLPALILLFFTVFQVFGHSHWMISNDSYRYARSTLQILGEPKAKAQQDALKAFCSSRAHRNYTEGVASLDTFQEPEPHAQFFQNCMGQAKNGALSPNQPRYDRIFETRPGYPLLLAPAVAAFGVLRGMWLMALLMTLLSAGLVYRIAREAGLAVPAAGVGMAAFLLSPLCDASDGSMGGLTEGPAIATTLAVVLGGLWLIRGRVALGAVVTVLGYLVLCLTKYSTGMMLAGAFAAVGVLLAVIRPELRKWQLHAFTGISALTVLGVSAATHLWQLPGMNETLQDTFANHFTQPDVPNTTSLLLRLNGVYWQHWLMAEGYSSFYLPLLVVTCWIFVRLRGRAPVLLWLCLGIWLVGMAAAVAHPVVDQGFRLWLPAWLPVPFGLALGADHLVRLRDRSGDAQAPAAAPEPVSV